MDPRHQHPYIYVSDSDLPFVNLVNLANLANLAK
jgi:hypothetical protein